MEFLLGLHPQRCRFSSILFAVDQINEKHRSSWMTARFLADVPDCIRSQSRGKSVRSLAQVFFSWIPELKETECLMNTWRIDLSSVQFFGFVHLWVFVFSFEFCDHGTFQVKVVEKIVHAYGVTASCDSGLLSLQERTEKVKSESYQSSLQPTKLGSQLP